MFRCLSFGIRLMYVLSAVIASAIYSIELWKTPEKHSGVCRVFELGYITLRQILCAHALAMSRDVTGHPKYYNHAASVQRSLCAQLVNCAIVSMRHCCGCMINSSALALHQLGQWCHVPPVSSKVVLIVSSCLYQSQLKAHIS